MLPPEMVVLTSPDTSAPLLVCKFVTVPPSTLTLTESLTESLPVEPLIVLMVAFSLTVMEILPILLRVGIIIFLGK